MISEPPHQHQPPQTSSGSNSTKCHVRLRFLKPTVFYSSKQTPNKLISHDIKSLDQSNFFKKYFGHKVSYVKRSTQLVSILHSKKLLQKIAFDKAICQKDSFKSSCDLVLLGNGIATPEILINKILKGFRGKLSLVFKQETFNVAQIIKSKIHNHLQSLEITLQKIKQLSFDKATFDGLQSLQSFSLKFDPKFEKQCGWDSRLDHQKKLLDFEPNSYQQNPLSFLFLLLQKTHLKRLELNLAPYSLSSFALSYLLLAIEQANIPKWYVKSGMGPEDLIELVRGKDVQPSPNFTLNLVNSLEVIKKIDFLGLYAINYALEDRNGEWYSDECGSKEFSPQILSKTPHLLSTSRKVLDITLTDMFKTEALVLTTLLEKFTFLKGLYIKAPEDRLIFDKEFDKLKPGISPVTGPSLFANTSLGANISQRNTTTHIQGSTRPGLFTGLLQRNVADSQAPPQTSCPSTINSSLFGGLLLQGNAPVKTDVNSSPQTCSTGNASLFGGQLFQRNVSMKADVNSASETKQSQEMNQNSEDLANEVKSTPLNDLVQSIKNKPISDIKAPENQVQSEKISPKDFPWMRNLKFVLLSIVDVVYDHKRSRHDKPFKELMAHLKDHCKTLETLNVFSANTIYKNDHGVRSRIENSVKIPCESLTGFSSLQKLEINSDGKGLKGLTETLGSLKNLKKLRLNFCDNDKPFTLGERGDKRDRNPEENFFDGLVQLKELELFVRPDQLDSGIPASVHWAKYFAKEIHKLRNLEILRVFDSKDTQIEMEVFEGLLQALSEFTNLKEIIIHSKIKINMEALAFAAKVFGNLEPKNIEDFVANYLQVKVNEIIKSNQNLKIIDIRTVQGVKFNRIFYNTN